VAAVVCVFAALMFPAINGAKQAAKKSPHGSAVTLNGDNTFAGGVTINGGAVVDPNVDGSVTGGWSTTSKKIAPTPMPQIALANPATNESKLTPMDPFPKSEVNGEPAQTRIAGMGGTGM